MKYSESSQIIVILSVLIILSLILVVIFIFLIDSCLYNECKEENFESNICYKWSKDR